MYVYSFPNVLLVYIYYIYKELYTRGGKYSAELSVMNYTSSRCRLYIIESPQLGIAI